MKKIYLLMTSLVLLVAMQANAKVSSITDLYGKYQFTATIKTTEAGKSYASLFKDNCEVTITKDASGYYLASIQGLMGADYNQLVSSFDAAACTFAVNNPNANYTLWNGGYIGVTNEAGDAPFGQNAFEMVYNFDPETKEITIADFAIAGFAWPNGECTTTIYANVKDAKMTLIEAEYVEIPNIAGHWTFEGSLRNENVSPKGFTVDLEAADETLKNWNATFTFEGYEDAAFTLPGTFDGSMLAIPFDSIYLSEKDSIRFGTRSSATAKNGTFEFKYTSSTAMALWSYIYVRKDTVKNGQLGGMTYQVFEGNAFITREDPNAYNWAGTYNVTVPEEGYTQINDEVSFPTEFNVVISKVSGGFALTEFMGYGNLNQPITVNEDGKSAEINLTSYYGPAFLVYLGNAGDDYSYYVLTDGNGQPTSLKITLQEDGSIALGDFSIQYWLYMANTYDPLALMSGATMTRSTFNWAGTYALTADVESLDGNEYPAEFEIKVEEKDGVYFVMKFMETDIYSFNYGNTVLTPSDDTMSATFNTGIFVGGAYPSYLQIYAADGSASALTFTVNAGNTISADDFLITSLNYETNATAKAARYTNVTITKVAEDTSIENIVVESTVAKGIFDIHGRKVENTVAPGIYIVNGKKTLVK